MRGGDGHRHGGLTQFDHTDPVLDDHRPDVPLPGRLADYRLDAPFDLALVRLVIEMGHVGVPLRMVPHRSRRTGCGPAVGPVGLLEQGGDVYRLGGRRGPWSVGTDLPYNPHYGGRSSSTVLRRRLDRREDPARSQPCGRPVPTPRPHRCLAWTYPTLES